MEPEILRILEAAAGRPLSVLGEAGEGQVTYCAKSDPSLVRHLKDCLVIGPVDFEPDNESIDVIQVSNPQLVFYKLSRHYREDYLDNKNLRYSEACKSWIHRDAEIGTGVDIAPGCVIAKSCIGDNTMLMPGVTIYAKTVIGSGVTIEANTVIGGTGVMWVWDGRERAYLEQLGNVVIENDVKVGALCKLVRGSANESTVLEHDSCMSHGCLIGHGCRIGHHGHFANGISLGGGCTTGPYNFLGSGVVLSAGVNISTDDVVLGSGAIVVSHIDKNGIYVGNPARWIKETTSDMSGLPAWTL